MRRLGMALLLWTGCVPKAADTSAAPQDLDGDGFAVPEDCDDSDVSVHPDAREVCDGVDQDCDGEVDEGAISDVVWFTDADGDGFAGTEGVGCPDWSAASDVTDCDDEDPDVHPEAAEVCDARDNDCDGLVDDDDDDWDVASGTVYLVDDDGDGFGSGDEVSLCEPGEGVTTVPGDCDDRHADVYPGATELCNHRDDDCDGEIEAPGTCEWTWASDLQTSGWYGTTSEPYAGSKVLVAGDVDGLGSIDLVVASLSITGMPEVWITDGSAVGKHTLDPDETIAHVMIDQVTSTDVDDVAVCDVDRDGQLDVVLGAGSAAPPDGSWNGGVVYVMNSPRGEIDADEAADAWIWGDLQGMGRAVGCGNPSGDGAIELVLGAPYEGFGGAVYGVAMPLSGGAWADDVASWRVRGAALASHAGQSLVVADFSGDGVDDVAIGAEYMSVDGVSWTGGGYVVLGPIAGDISALDADTTLLGEGHDWHVGSELAVLPDQDGDGLADLAIGGRGAPMAYVMNGPGPVGPTYVYELDARVDLTDSVLLSASVTGGDFNGDGRGDLAVAHSGWQVVDGAGGAFAVVPGPLEGLVFAAGIDQLVASSRTTSLGFSVHAADVDGDDRDDLLVGVPRDSWSGTKSVEDSPGAAHLFFGADLLPGP